MGEIADILKINEVIGKHEKMGLLFSRKNHADFGASPTHQVKHTGLVFQQSRRIV